MTTATENTLPLTPGMEGAVRQAIEKYLVGLGLEDSASLEERLRIRSGELHLFAIGDLGRKLALCAEVLSDAEAFSIIDPREDVLSLLEECENEAAGHVEFEEKTGIHTDDLALAIARLTILGATRKTLVARASGGDA